MQHPEARKGGKLYELLDRYFDSEEEIRGAMLAAGVDPDDHDGNAAYLFDGDGWILVGQA